MCFASWTYSFWRCCTKLASYEYKNKSATNGAQLVPIGIPPQLYIIGHNVHSIK